MSQAPKAVVMGDRAELNEDVIQATKEGRVITRGGASASDGDSSAPAPTLPLMEDLWGLPNRESPHLLHKFVASSRVASSQPWWV